MESFQVSVFGLTNPDEHIVSKSHRIIQKYYLLMNWDNGMNEQRYFGDILKYIRHIGPYTSIYIIVALVYLNWLLE